jgi:hypothetical protein
MNTLFTFGCSFTEDFEDVPKYYNTVEKEMSSRWEYIETFLDGNVPKSWPKLLSEKLELDIKNYGEGGQSNMRIFENFISKCDDVKCNDIVIVNWTGMSRFKWAYNKNFITILPNSNFIYGEINQSTIEDVLVNKSDEIWKNEVYGFIKIIDKLSDLVGFKVYYWSADDTIINSENDDFRKDKKYLLGNIKPRFGLPFNINTIFHDYGAKTIFEETNYQIVDHHYGKISNEIIADLFYKHIKKQKD